MHLNILENYICDLMQMSLEKPNTKRRLDLICGELMDVLIQQERVLPDFVIDGDSKMIISYGTFADTGTVNHDKQQQPSSNINQSNGIYDQQAREKDDSMKKVAWLGTTAIISGICFLIGFFVAP